jgi:hypothetical protein
MHSFLTINKFEIQLKKEKQNQSNHIDDVYMPFKDKVLSTTSFEVNSFKCLKWKTCTERVNVILICITKYKLKYYQEKVKFVEWKCLPLLESRRGRFSRNDSINWPYSLTYYHKKSNTIDSTITDRMSWITPARLLSYVKIKCSVPKNSCQSPHQCNRYVKRTQVIS